MVVGEGTRGDLNGGVQLVGDLIPVIPCILMRDRENNQKDQNRPK